MPSRRTSTLSTWTKSRGRWATRITVVPPALSRPIASTSAASPALVEAGARLVEDHQPRRAEHRPGEADALPLAARERRALRPDLGGVALGQAQDHLVHAGELRRLDHGFVGRVGQARDVVAHGAGEQLDVLRQVADMAAEVGRDPSVHLGAVEADMARGRAARPR